MITKLFKINIITFETLFVNKVKHCRHSCLKYDIKLVCLLKNELP